MRRHGERDLDVPAGSAVLTSSNRGAEKCRSCGETARDTVQIFILDLKKKQTNIHFRSLHLSVLTCTHLQRACRGVPPTDLCLCVRNISISHTATDKSSAKITFAPLSASAEPFFQDGVRKGGKELNPEANICS